MDAIFKKLNFKNQPNVLIINAPNSFQANMDAMTEYTNISFNINELEEIEFAIIFVTKKAETDALLPEIAPKLKGDAILWFAYPKQSSKNYKADFNRDNGWTAMGEQALEAVRQVAIDADWSALRFRKVEYIKKMTRRESFALSKEGKSKTTQKGK